jgi:hypothetical protein
MLDPPHYPAGFGPGFGLILIGHHNPIFYAPIKYLNSDCIAIGSICEGSCFRYLITSRSPIAIRLIFVDLLWKMRDFGGNFTVTQRILIRSQIGDREVIERWKMLHSHIDYIAIWSELRYFMGGKTFDAQTGKPAGWWAVVGVSCGTIRYYVSSVGHTQPRPQTRNLDPLRTLPSFSGMKCAIFVQRSTITDTDEHLSDSGSLIMKSMEIESHGWYGNSSGCRSTHCFQLSCLTAGDGSAVWDLTRTEGTTPRPSVPS